jgi:hypothetical protein
VRREPGKFTAPLGGVEKERGGNGQVPLSFALCRWCGQSSMLRRCIAAHSQRTDATVACPRVRRTMLSRARLSGRGGRLAHRGKILRRTKVIDARPASVPDRGQAIVRHSTARPSLSRLKIDVQ